jgi:hypothetical protein
MFPTLLQRIWLKYKEYSLVEYSLVLVVMAVTVIVGLVYLGPTANSTYLQAFCAVQPNNPYITHSSRVENSSLIVTVNVRGDDTHAALYQHKSPFNLYSSGLIENGIELSCANGICTGSIPFFKSRFYYLDVYNPKTATNCTVKANT